MGLSMRTFAAMACLACVSARAATLTGDTNRPEMSVFIPGEEVALDFKAEGLDKPTKLLLDILDEHDVKIEAKELPVSPDAAGKWEARVKAPAAKLGFYRAEAKLADGTTIAKLKSRPAGFITYCVVPDPATRKLYPDTQTFFGMLGGFSSKVDIMPYMGIRWVGGGLPRWEQIEKDRPGQIDAAPPAEKRAPDSWTIYRMPIGIACMPDWAKGSVKGTMKPEAEDAFVNYCAKTAQHFATSTPDRTERLYEVLGEQLCGTFQGTPEQLVRSCALAYQAIHANDPKAVVIGPTWGGLGCGLNPWEDSFFKAGIAKHLDAFATHAYRNELNDAEFVETIQTLRAKLSGYFGRDVPLYATEFGFMTKEKRENELKQARVNVRSNLVYLGEGWRMGMSFYIADYSAEPGYGYCYGLNPKADFGTDKTAPKPAVPAYAAMTWLLEGHQATARLDWLGEGTLGYAYQAYDNPDDIVLALWDYSGGAKTVTVPLGAPEVAVLDWMGNAKTTPTSNGSLSLKLSEEPVYIKGAAQALWGAGAVKPLSFNGDHLEGFPGAELLVQGKATAPNGTVVVRLNGTTLEKRFQLGPSGAAQDFSVTLPLPATLAAGRHIVMADLADAAGKSLYAQGAPLKSREPVEIGDISPLFDNDAKPRGVRVTLTEARQASSASWLSKTLGAADDTKGTLALRVKGVPESGMEAAFSLSPGETRVLELRNEALEVKPGVPYEAELKLALADGHRATSAAGLSFTAAPRRGRTGWKDIPALALRGKADVVRSPEHYSGVKDQAATFRFAWDEQALHFQAEVVDDVFMQPYEGFETWRGDSIQLDIDLDGGKRIAVTGNALADAGARRFSELDLALTKNGPEVYRTVTFNPSRHPICLLPKDAVTLTVRRQGETTVYEASIPWRTLGAAAAPPSGSAIGFAVEFNDRDADQHAQFDVSGLGLFTLQQPAQFGKLTLLP